MKTSTIMFGFLILSWLVVLFGFLFPWLSSARDDMMWIAGYMLVVATGLAALLWGNAVYKALSHGNQTLTHK